MGIVLVNLLQLEVELGLDLARWARRQDSSKLGLGAWICHLAGVGHEFV